MIGILNLDGEGRIAITNIGHGNIGTECVGAIGITYRLGNAIQRIFHLINQIIESSRQRL